MGDLVELEKANGIATVTLTNAPANGYSYAMMRELDEAILDVRMDESVHAIVLTGAGESFFCAGADIAQLKVMTPDYKYNFCLHANETLQRLEQTPKLVIAALNGNTVGGGLEIAMAADLRIARRGTAKYGLPEVSLGVLPGTGGTQRLVRIVGKSRAIELMVTGRLFGIDEAEKLGVVDQVFDADSREAFLEQIQAYAEQFCPPGKAARAVGRIKRSVQSGAEIPFESALTLERELQQQLFQSDDAKEGLAAYIEKRAPAFSNR